MHLTIWDVKRWFLNLNRKIMLGYFGERSSALDPEQSCCCSVCQIIIFIHFLILISHIGTKYVKVTAERTGLRVGHGKGWRVGLSGMLLAIMFSNLFKKFCALGSWVLSCNAAHCMCRCYLGPLHHPVGLGKENKCNMLMVLLFSVPWTVKSFVSDPRVSCLLLASLKYRQTNFLVVSRVNSHRLHGSWQIWQRILRCIDWTINKYIKTSTLF